MLANLMETISDGLVNCLFNNFVLMARLCGMASLLRCTPYLGRFRAHSIVVLHGSFWQCWSRERLWVVWTWRGAIDIEWMNEWRKEVLKSQKPLHQLIYGWQKSDEIFWVVFLLHIHFLLSRAVKSCQKTHPCNHSRQHRLTMYT